MTYAEFAHKPPRLYGQIVHKGKAFDLFTAGLLSENPEHGKPENYVS